MTIKEMCEQRAKLVIDARKLYEAAKSANRALTADENRQCDEMMNKVDELRTQIETAQADEKREKQLADAARWGEQSAGRKTDPEGKKADESRTITWGDNFHSGQRRVTVAGRAASDEYRGAWRNWLAYGADGMTTADRDEVRAVQADSPTLGGYTLAPQTFVAELIKFVDNALVFRQLARVLPAIPSSTSLGAPSLDTDVADADWTAELGTGSADSSMAFGKRELRPHPLAKRILASNTLLRASAINAEGWVLDRLGYKHGVALEKGYMTGTGAQQPLGVFTASSLGISTGRDVSTGNTTTSIQADNLFEVKYSLKPQYQATGTWLFHRTALKQIRTLKDGEGRYIWNPGFSGRPDTLLDRPVIQSEYAPSTFTTGLYVGLFGDFSFYWIVDSLNFQVQRLVELYAATNQTGFIGRMESDGMPVLEEAFARVKLA